MKSLLLALLSACALVALAETGGGVSPEEALARLKEGNARFVGGKPLRPHAGTERIKEVASGQKPFAIVLSCSDSRVPPEILFDAGIGDLFVIRVAGNVADVDEIATIEYGVEHLGARLVVVMGHGSCGAVTAVVKDAEVGGSLPGLLDNVRRAVKALGDAGGGSESARIEAAIRMNVKVAIQDLFEKSGIVRHAFENGGVRVVGAHYALDSGAVEFSSLAEGERVRRANPAWLFPAAVLLFLVAVHYALVSRRRLFGKAKAPLRFIASFLAVAGACAASGLVAGGRGGGTDPDAWLGAGMLGFAATVAFAVIYSVSHLRAFKRFCQESLASGAPGA